MSYIFALKLYTGLLEKEIPAVEILMFFQQRIADNYHILQAIHRLTLYKV